VTGRRRSRCTWLMSKRIRLRSRNWYRPTISRQVLPGTELQGAPWLLLGVNWESTVPNSTDPLPGVAKLKWG